MGTQGLVVILFNAFNDISNPEGSAAGHRDLLQRLPLGSIHNPEKNFADRHRCQK
ncbi:hypothetical protein D3C75_1274810 [compost metagenome]